MSQRTGKPSGTARTPKASRAGRRTDSPAPRLTGSPARRERGRIAVSARTPSEAAAPGPGAWVVLYLRDPREKFLAALLRMEPAGIWVRGIELESFDSWARERAARSESGLGLSSFFVPFLRVEKLVADEPMGPVPSFAQRFSAITGRSLSGALAE